jgi:hypothetical protein
MEKTIIVTRDNFDERFPDDEQERFWTLVRRTLKVFGADPQRAEEYRRKLKDARTGERIAVYHTSPLSIAADLAGWSGPIPKDKLRSFLELQRQYADEFGISLDLPSNHGR